MKVLGEEMKYVVQRLSHIWQTVLETETKDEAIKAEKGLREQEPESVLRITYHPGPKFKEYPIDFLLEIGKTVFPSDFADYNKNFSSIQDIHKLSEQLSAAWEKGTFNDRERIVKILEKRERDLYYEKMEEEDMELEEKYFMGGYYKYERSSRSQRSINYHIVPESMVDRGRIDEFLDDMRLLFSKEDMDYLKTVSVAKWKYVLKVRVGAYSWHHTSSWYNKTDHYNLSDVAECLLDEKDTLDKKYKEYIAAKKKKAKEYKFGIINVAIWVGETRKKRRFKGYDEVAGIILGEFLYYKKGHTIAGSIGKYKINANKVKWIKTFDSYEELIKCDSKYSKTKKVFNKLISEKAI